MFGSLEWFFWFIVVGGILTMIYLITMHFVLKKGRERSGQFEIEYLEELFIRDIDEKIG